MKKINVILMSSGEFSTVVLAMENPDETKELKAELNSLAKKKDFNELRTLMVKNTMIIPTALQGEISEDRAKTLNISFYIRQCMLK